MIINIDLTSNDFILCCILLSCICIHVMYLSTIADSHILFMILYYVASIVLSIGVHNSTYTQRIVSQVYMRCMIREAQWAWQQITKNK